MNFKFVRFTAIATAIAAMITATSYADFAKTRTYENHFDDVSADSWYAANVADAYELGFMNGDGWNIFNPDGDVTVAAGITIAARIHAIYNGKEEPTNSMTRTWYDNYVRYAIENGIMKEGSISPGESSITRAEMASLIAAALPDDYFKPINNVKEIPDVNLSASYADALLKLYNAGVVMGSDAYGTFNPDAPIKRSECAAIIGRVAFPDKRLSKTLETNPAKDAYLLAENDRYTHNLVNSDTAVLESVSSGWEFDNRGGIPRTSIKTPTVPLLDISTTEGMALIRKFNPITDGVITADFVLSVEGAGGYVEFRDINGKSTYKAYFDGNGWSVQNAAVAAPKADSYTFRVILNLETKTASTLINGTSYGETTLSSDSILDFRFATDEKGTPELMPGSLRMTVNYGVNENFDIATPSDVYGWTVQGDVKAEKKELVLTGESSLTKTFAPLTGKYLASTYFILPEGTESIRFAVSCGGYDAISITTAGGKLYANGTELYTLTPNMWYRLRLEANPSLESVAVKLNGRTLAAIPLGTTALPDTLTVASTSGAARFDNIEVYATPDHPDYAPIPENKANLNDYVVMVNVCSLWRDNGTHYGWGVISPFDDNKPVLGYYDEGSPEVADWEIKFMAEHGIDVQAFCWYNDNDNGPVKTPAYSYALNEGFKNAKYQDYMKYILLLELQAGKGFDMDQFKNYMIPYWFENYFLDESYLKLDNKLVIHSYSTSLLSTEKYFGSMAAAKEALAYLNDCGKAYGFAGVILLGDTGTELVDGIAAYSWSRTGYLYQTNVDRNTENYKKGASAAHPYYMVPTVSVGFNSVAWLNERYPLMTLEDYEKTNKWVKETYIPQYADKSNWQNNLVLLSTWNEYGEGTYISPSGLNGFGYLDVIRKIYTNLPASEKADVYPTANQLARINHLYPQSYRVLERLRENEDLTTGSLAEDDKLESKETYILEEANVYLGGSADPSFSEEGVTATADESGDPRVELIGLEPFDISKVTALKITMRVPKGYRTQVFFTTDGDPELSESKSFYLDPDSDEMKTYTIHGLSKNKAWKGKLLSLRVDPFNAKDLAYTVQSVEFLGEPSQDNVPTLIVNDIRINSPIAGEEAGGKTLFPLDPQTAVHNIMHTYMTWNKDAGILSLAANNHTITFTVGSDKYTLDGKQGNLGYTMYLVDGLPMLDYELAAKSLGHTVEKDGNKLVIKTTNYDRYRAMTERVEGVWEFNDYDCEGWYTTHMELSTTGKGYMHAVTSATYAASGSQDPIILNNNLNMPAKKFKAVEIKLRYNYYGKSYLADTTNTDRPRFYFLTNLDPSWNEAKSIKAFDNYTSRNSGEEWQVFRQDLTQLETWRDTITDLRFDPFDADGMVEIDYIRFEINPDFDPEAEEIAKRVLHNGDAEDTKNVAFRPNDGETVTIEVDSEDPTNHVYRIVGKPNVKAWTYVLYDYPFEKGITYKYAFDIRTLPDTAGNSSDYSVSLNLQYQDRAGANQSTGTRDHLVEQFTVPAGSEWTHIEGEWTVSTIDVENAGMFSIFINPPSESSAGSFELDNVVFMPADMETK